MTKEELELKERELAVKERELDLEAKKLSNEKLRRDADQFQMAKENEHQKFSSRGASLASQRPENKHAGIRRTCNHHMGGRNREAFVQGIGEASKQYCVSKVKLPTGDVMIRCNRCRKVWVPPLESEHTKNGKLDKEAFNKAQEEYNEAYNFDCALDMIILPQYRWSRGGKAINREVTHRFVKGIIGK